ncbi:amidase [Aquisalimonas lutea]|uniref:amidase n=1 Tax=Aquisalimonas lutea TaxID=1327750 RepID=UPI0025B3DFD5|nr:amidase [Aquisalimonas lutea]MDN3517463.1 amidase [Aquisalimonas lutea]
MNASPPSLGTTLARLDNGETTAEALLGSALERIGAADDGSVYTALFPTTARAQAHTVDGLRAAGAPRPPLAGLPVALKALFDVAGAITHAGSRLLRDAPPASADAAAVQRLRKAGAVLTGHTNMTEFAYSGVGLNPHFGTPDNPLAPGRIPGGSSSGSAVAVARGMAAAGIGTDTGGSVRIPAAFCGLVGFKPTQKRVPRDGVFPLSTTLDTVGPIAPTVDCCARLDAVMSAGPSAPLTPRPVHGLRLAVPTTYVRDDMDEHVAAAFDRALRRLRDAGAVVEDVEAAVLGDIPDLLEGGGFTAAESYHVHRGWLETRGDDYDPRVRSRMERGAGMTAADYLELLQRRQRMMARVDTLLADYDALVMPTVPIVPPLLSELERDEDYARLNLLALRNPTVGNLLDLCGISLPCHEPGALPVGCMLLGPRNGDRELLRRAAGVEALVAGSGA